VEIMESLGIPGAKGGKFIIKNFDTEDINDKDALEMDIALITDAKLPLSDDYFYERYNRPRPANYDELKKRLSNGTSLTDLNEDPLKPVIKSKVESSKSKVKEKEGKLKKLMARYKHFLG
jgi:hypothetical protein